MKNYGRQDDYNQGYSNKTTPLYGNQQNEGYGQLEDNGGAIDKKTKVYFYLLNYINFVMALDFMIVFLTVASYWVQVGGSRSTISVVFALYNIAQVAGIPFVGFWMDRGSMKLILIITLSVNIAGNIIYSLGATWFEYPNNITSHDVTAQRFMIVGRILTGLGSSNTITGSQMIVDVTTTTTQRASQIASYNLCAFLGRVLGPLIALGLLYIPDTSSRGLVIDSNTMPAWVTAIFGIIGLIATILLPTPPRRNSERPQTGFFQSFFNGEAQKLSTILFSYLLVMIAFWGWYPNITTIAFAQYHFAEQYGSWAYLALFAPVMIGTTAGTKHVKGLLKRQVPQSQILLRSHIFMAVGVIIMFHFDESHSDWRYWVGSIILSIGFIMTTSILPSVFTMIVERQGSSIHMGKYIALLAFFVAGGRSLGTVWTGQVLDIKPTAGNTNACCSYEDISSQNDSCCNAGGVNVLLGIVLGVLALNVLIILKSLGPIVDQYAPASSEQPQTDAQHERLYVAGSNNEEY